MGEVEIPGNKEKEMFVVDPFIAGNWNSNELLLPLINDCRANIYNPNPTEEDNKYFNLEFVTVNVNGWPQTYLITTRDIKKGEELQTFYGKDFSVALKKKIQNEEMIQSKKNRINKIVQDINYLNTN